MQGDKAALRSLLQQKADVNAPQVDGATALHWAVYRDDLEAADLLIRAGANVKAANRAGVTPLAMASLYGNTAMIDRLLKAGADPKERGPNGETMLMYAARNGNPAAIKVLLEAGADVNATENLRGTTALMWAAEQKHPLAVKALLDGGADCRRALGSCGSSPKLHGHARARRERRGRAPATPCRGGRRADLSGTARIRARRAASTPEVAGSRRPVPARRQPTWCGTRHAAAPIRTTTSSSRVWLVGAAEA